MVHAAKSEDLIEIGLSRAPGGAGNGFVLEKTEGCAPGWFTADPDAFAVHEAVMGLATVKMALPADVVGGAAAIDVAKGALPEVKRLITVSRSRLVMGCAIDGRRPDWVPRPRLAFERGAPIYDRDRRGVVRRDASGRPKLLLWLVRPVGDMPWEVARARLLYQVWIGALGALKAALDDGRLKRWSLTDLLPEEEPWRGVG